MGETNALKVVSARHGSDRRTFRITDDERPCVLPVYEPKLLSNVPRHPFLSIASVAWTMFGVARVKAIHVAEMDKE